MKQIKVSAQETLVKAGQTYWGGGGRGQGKVKAKGDAVFHYTGNAAQRTSPPRAPAFRKKQSKRPEPRLQTPETWIYSKREKDNENV